MGLSTALASLMEDVTVDAVDANVGGFMANRVGFSLDKREFHFILG